MAKIPRIDLRRCRAARALAVFVLALVMAGGAARGESPATAEAAASFLGGFRDQGSAMLADPGLGPDDRRAAVRRLLTASFDLQTIGRFVLGKYWRRASLQERDEFRRLFEDYAAAAIARRLDGWRGPRARRWWWTGACATARRAGASSTSWSRGSAWRLRKGPSSPRSSATTAVARSLGRPAGQAAPGYGAGPLAGLPPPG
jgi:hypothetical protein